MTGRAKSRKAAPPAPAPLSIGVIADTHGVLSPAVPRLFAGVTHIIHAGDIGRRAVLRELERVAPVTAVCGNADTGKLAASLPATATGEVGGVRYLAVHKPKAVRRLLAGAHRDGVRLIVTGHLHEPSFHWEDGILHLNPGSASAPEEGDSQPTVAVVTVLPEGLAVNFIPVPRTTTVAAKTRTKVHGARTIEKGASGAKAGHAAKASGAAEAWGVTPLNGRPKTDPATGGDGSRPEGSDRADPAPAVAAVAGTPPRPDEAVTPEPGAPTVATTAGPAEES